MVEIGIPELTIEQVTKLCERAEKIARNYILSKVPANRIVVLDVIIDAVGTKPISINVDINLLLSSLMKDYDVKTLTKEATKQAFDHVEEYLRELKCKSKEY
ncbi:DUF3194 domain-containing protein [Candidatus Bathyarchaeota archaeon]|nr:DUF3194 domain-containing protein [Candidatus Bathyarchaeota archaeon]